MEAVIPGKSLLLFSKVIQCLTKIGEDLYFDATVDKVLEIADYQIPITFPLTSIFAIALP